MLRKLIIHALQRATNESTIHIESPEDLAHGDYATNVAMIMGKKQNRNPQEVAQEIVDKLNQDKDLTGVTEKIEIAGPGFINFFLNREYLISNLNQILEKKENYGKSESGKDKTMVIDYSAPNIAKYFGIGHLRSTIIGQAIRNLYDYLGYQTIGDNHLGDWGTQFGMIIAAIVSKNLDASKLSVEQLVQLYVEFNKEMESNPSLRDQAKDWFKKLEEGNAKARDIWQKTKETSLKEYERIYEMLGVRIENALGESFYEDKMPATIDEVRQKGISTKSEGAEIIEFNNMPPAILVKSDGTTTYFTRDLATIKYRIENWDPQLFIYEVGSEQTLHFRQVFETAEKLGWGQGREFVHIAHGLIRFKEGKMSTRSGRTIKLEEVLQEAIIRAKNIIEKSETNRGINSDEAQALAKQVGIGAVKYFDLMHHYANDIIFDWEKLFVLEGNSGPYLQYTYARSQSVLAKSEIRNPALPAGRPKLQTNSNLQIQKIEESLLRRIAQFPEVISTATKNYSPNLLCNYLFDLAQSFNTFYNKHRILSTDHSPQTTDFRIALTAATGQVLANGLTILGISTPKKM